nr:FAD-dependent monooxygenase [Propylenella binzhouense]
MNVVAIGGTPAERPAAAGLAPVLADLLAAVPDWVLWPLLGVDETRPWVRGAVALVGDAAHAMLPTAAQGGAQAIEDAWALAAALRAGSLARLPARLSAFEAARRPRVERICRTARQNLAIYRLSGPAGAARDLAIAALPGRAHLARLDWLYGYRPDFA